jgi:multiple sugar transport system permease protein
VLLAPAFLVLTLFLVVPILFTLWMSTRVWSGINPPAESTFLGLRYYQDLLLNDTILRNAFANALRNTTFFALGVVPLQTMLALLLASIVNQRWLRGKGFFRTSFYFPSITSSVAISLIFLWIYQSGGLLNQVIHAIWSGYQPSSGLSDPTGLLHNLLRVFGITPRTAPEWLTATNVFGLSLWEWISGPSVALSAIMMLNIWTTAGTMMIIFLAGLQDIPRPLYEAAAVDGATGWDTFWRITVPLLRPTIFFVVTLGLIGTYQVFDQIYVMTGGQPADTTVSLAYLIYRDGFNNAQMGLASATSVLLFVVIFVLTLFQRRIVREGLD